jgi:manganese/zinc/iron transport system substrate-binding protein
MFKYIVCTTFLALSFGCSKAPQKEPDEKKLKVLSTIGMIDDFVGEIAKDRVQHIALIQGEIDPHSYELVKGDDEKITSSEIVFSNGLGLEHGASLRYQLEHHPHLVSVGDKVQKEYPDKILKEHGEVDPHIWMDPSLWALTIDPIVQALSEADPENEAFYKQNGEVLKDKIMQMHEKIKIQLQNIPENKRYLVTTHDAFNYFTRAYLATPDENTRSLWQKRFVAPEGLAPEGQLSTADIQKIIQHICKFHIQVVFPESNLSKDSLKKIVHACKEKGCPVRISKETLYADAMGPKKDGGYMHMMEHDANVLSKEWLAGLNEK